MNVKLIKNPSLGHSSSNTTFTVKSEQDCQDFLRREVSSLPEREVPPNNQEPPPSDGQVTYLPRKWPVPVGWHINQSPDNKDRESGDGRHSLRIMTTASVIRAPRRTASCVEVARYL
ncbi:hypothetical protein AK830_g10233 [Neonectria ditissima]|uniref:Uncharacterized protein n=1 Tax=Neonectria ditissima TaxID=78410 RepID=A0A0P7B752_9HYPO|nr:hypothetical protein AK830_g10233 [Neonectria ditissima]